MDLLDYLNDRSNEFFEDDKEKYGKEDDDTLIDWCVEPATTASEAVLKNTEMCLQALANLLAANAGMYYSSFRCFIGIIIVNGNAVYIISPLSHFSAF